MSEHEPGPLRSAIARKGSLLQTMKAVAWAFFGVRRSSDHALDLSRLNPVHLVIGAVLGGVLFVLSLLALVNWVIGSGIAA